jgi:outer membrane protein assembly factor BamB
MLPLPVASLLLISLSVRAAEDWPQWLGPRRDASSSQVVPSWKGELKVSWRKPVGEGHSSPIIANGKVFYHAKVKDQDAEEVTALNADTGEQIWHAAYPRGKFSSIFGNGPRATPAYSDNRLFTFGVTGILTAWDANKGKRLWQVDTLKQFEAPNLLFGMSGSPLVDGERVFINVGGKGASIVAFRTADGSVDWKALDDKASYASPILVQTKNSDRQLVFLTHQGLASLEPLSGKLLWRHPFVDLLSESSTTPIIADNLIIASSITLGSIGVHLGAASGPTSGEVWKNVDLTSYFSTPVAIGPYVYLVTGTKPPALRSQADLHCIEARTGKVLWKKPNVGKYHACLLRTGDIKLFLLEESGNLVLLDPNPTEYRELARAKVAGESWSHPALANGRLYVRDAKELVSIELPKP